MGQKVSPIGMRVGVIRDWQSRWYADDKEFGTLLMEDVKIRELVENLHDVNVVGNIPENTSAELMIRGVDPKGEIYNEELRKEPSPKHAKRI